MCCCASCALRTNPPYCCDARRRRGDGAGGSGDRARPGPDRSGGDGRAGRSAEFGRSRIRRDPRAATRRFGGFAVSRQLHLNAFLMSTGHHEASWRLPESNPFANTSVAHYQALAQLAERGKFDSIFFADSPVLFGDVGRRPAGSLEPTVLLTAIAAVTSRIGLIATASTTYNDPFNLARRFASVDHVSGGRAGWNVVTTAAPDAAANFGLDGQPTHLERYERADEFMAVAYGLWDSWDDGAIVADKATGVWADG